MVRFYAEMHQTQAKVRDAHKIMAWPFLVGGVICLVNSVNERDLNLLNSYVIPESRATS